MFCRETVRDLRRVSAGRDDYPAVLFVHQGTPAEGQAFFGKYWRAARAIADTELKLYAVFAIHRGDIRQLIQPDLWRRAIANTLKGNFSGRPQGDTSLQPGLFLVQDGVILWQHPYRHSGDHPDWSQLPDIARSVAPVATEAAG
jgi:hypothetical protein